MKGTGQLDKAMWNSLRVPYEFAFLGSWLPSGTHARPLLEHGPADPDKQVFCWSPALLGTIHYLMNPGTLPSQATYALRLICVDQDGGQVLHSFQEGGFEPRHE